MMIPPDFLPMIYGLVDPLEPDHVRYVGKTKAPTRPRGHQYEALSADYHTHKIHWILKLLSEGRTYDIITIKQHPSDVSDDDLNTSEIFYIAKYRSEGHRLTNATDGGDGVVNLSPESRSRISEWNKKRWEDKEFREMMSSNTVSQWEDPIYRAFHLKRMNEEIKRRWEDPEYRTMMVKAQTDQWTDEQKSEHSKEMIELWADPTWAEERCEAYRQGQIERYKDPDASVKQSKSMQKNNTSPLVVQIYDTEVRIQVHTKFIRKDSNKGTSQYDRSLKMVEHLNERLISLKTSLEASV